jgi:hypothetical protein
MKDLHGGASATVNASPQRCIEVLRDIERYPQWYPDVVREVQVLETGTDGQARRAQAILHAAVGPISRDLPLLLNVTVTDTEVKLSRVANEPSDREHFDVTWRAEGSGESTHLVLALDAALDVPRLVPLGGVGDTLAEGFVTAATKEIQGG